MKALKMFEDWTNRSRHFVKEHGWGSLGSVCFHSFVFLLLLRFSMVRADTDAPQLPPAIIKSDGAETLDLPEDPPTKEMIPVRPEDPAPDARPVDQSKIADTSFDIASLQMDVVKAGVGKGTDGIGNWDDSASKGFEADSKAISPATLEGYYFGPRSGGSNGINMAIARFRKPGGPSSEPSVLRSLRWLKDRQNEDGSWPGAGSPTAMCGLALLCYMGHGEKPTSAEFGPTIRKAIEHLLSTQESNGRFRNAGANYVYGHAIATYALAESYGMTHMQVLKEPMERAVQVILDGQQVGGAFNYNYGKSGRRDLSVTAWQVQALKAALIAKADNKGLVDCLQRCVAGVKSFAAPGGGFGYDGPGASQTLTGAGVLCLQFLRHADNQAVARGLQATDGLLPSWPKGGGGTYGWYYMTQARFQDHGPLWTKWDPLMRKMLVKNQKEDGHWDSGSTHSSCPVYDTALCCLCLEVYYRYLPTFIREAEATAPAKTKDEVEAQVAVRIAL